MGKEIGEYIVELDHLLGTGGFGIVYRAYIKPNKTQVAAKQMTYTNPEDAKYINETTPLRLCHKNIIKCFDILFDEDVEGDIWIFLELCDFDLEVYCKKTKEEEDRLLVLQQCVNGLIFLHENKIVHRDLKPSNILIKGGVVKLADFGTAKKLGVTSLMTSKAGTQAFCAPEFFVEKGQDDHLSYRSSVDVFSMGLIIAFTCQDEGHLEEFKFPCK